LHQYLPKSSQAATISATLTERGVYAASAFKFLQTLFSFHSLWNFERRSGVNAALLESGESPPQHFAIESQTSIADCNKLPGQKLDFTRKIQRQTLSCKTFRVKNG